MVRMLSDQAQYYESHQFFTLDAKAVRSSLMTETGMWYPCLCGDGLIDIGNSQRWCKAPQVIAYKTRELGFRDWNFLEFTLAAEEINEFGLRNPVSIHTLMLRLLGKLPTGKDNSSEVLALRLGLMMPWRSKSDVMNKAQT